MDSSIQLNLAQKHFEAGFPDEAWRIVKVLIAAPDASQMAVTLAVTLRLAAGAFDDVVILCRRLLSQNPNDPDAWDNLGQALDQLAQPIEAIAAFERSVALSASNSSAYNNLGVVLSGQGRFAAAATAFSSALRHDPKNVAALVNLGVALVERGDVAQGLQQFEQALSLDPGNQAAHDNRLFALHNIVDDPKILFEKHRAWGRGIEQSAVAKVFANTRQPDRRLRVGYVSPDFRQHSVAFFVESLLQEHDRNSYAIYCYSQVAWPDTTTARFKKLADHWCDVRNLSTEATVDQIISDQIDILVDLAGHTMGNRLDVLAQRAAPIQLAAIGYPGTTGLIHIDGRLSDAGADLPANDTYSSESVIRLPRPMHCYSPPPFAPGTNALPYHNQGVVTFGSFNKLAKISDPTIKVWSDVLKAVPKSRLLIKTKPLAETATQSALAAKFAAFGIEEDRLELCGWNPVDEGHLATYHRVDIALDTYPYNGTTTTCEALWMGVPVITLAGQTHASRVGASLLESAGVPDLICGSPDEFVACAVKLSTEPTTLAALRGSMRQRVATSAICNAKAYTIDVERAYRALWQRYCASV